MVLHRDAAMSQPPALLNNSVAVRVAPAPLDATPLHPTETVGCVAGLGTEAAVGKVVTRQGSCVESSAGAAFVATQGQRCYVGHSAAEHDKQKAAVLFPARDRSSLLVIGKGGRPRTCPFGDKTRTALRRYLRVRAKHPGAKNDNPDLWLGYRGSMTDSGIRQMLERRCDAAE
ncbi:hypothetical protein [Nocardia sp. CA-135398]|uniref:hypothetical protein n=1 Tax=Nocardia sp. CA-135398 TaxID=3239977 RepID=UPI003D98771C